MDYEIIISVGGQKDYDHAIDYILYELKNPAAAISLIDDFNTVIRRLRQLAKSFPVVPSDNPVFQKYEIRKVHLERHQYKIFYHVEGNIVFVDAFLHDKQDFEKHF